MNVVENQLDCGSIVTVFHGAEERAANRPGVFQKEECEYRDQDDREDGAKTG